MEKGIEHWIKTSIGKWINADGIESVIKIRYQDTEFSDLSEIVSEAVMGAFNNEINAENTAESDELYDLSMDFAQKYSEKTFNDIMSDLVLVHNTMLAGIDRALAVQNQKEGI